MKKTTTYHEGNVSITVSPEGMLSFSSMAYAAKDVGDLYALLSDQEVIEALGVAPTGPDLTTAEGLDALPVGTRVVDQDGDTHVKAEHGGWTIIRWSYDDRDRNTPGIMHRTSATLMSFRPLTLDKEDN